MQDYLACVESAAMWREQARLGDAPYPSQPRPAGVDDITSTPAAPRAPATWEPVGVGRDPGGHCAV